MASKTPPPQAATDGSDEARSERQVNTDQVQQPSDESQRTHRKPIWTFRKKHMSPNDRFSASPFEKMQRYGTFPCKFVLNLAILALLCATAFTFELRRATSHHIHRRAIEKSFLPDGFREADQSWEMHNYLPTFVFFDMDSLKQHIVDSVDTYYSYVRASARGASYFSQSAQDPEIVKKPLFRGTAYPTNIRFVPFLADTTLGAADWSVTMRSVTRELDEEDPVNSIFGDGVIIDGSSLPQTLCLPRRDIFGEELFYAPCRCTNVSSCSAAGLVDNYHAFSIEYSLRSLELDLPTDSTVTYYWEISQQFDFSVRGLVTLTVSAEGKLVRSQSVFSSGVVISATCIFLCLWDAALRIRVVLSYRRFRRRYPHLFARKSSNVNRSLRTTKWCGDPRAAPPTGRLSQQGQRRRR